MQFALFEKWQVRATKRRVSVVRARFVVDWYTESLGLARGAGPLSTRARSVVPRDDDHRRPVSTSARAFFYTRAPITNESSESLSLNKIRYVCYVDRSIQSQNTRIFNVDRKKIRAIESQSILSIIVFCFHLPKRLTSSYF